MSREPLPPNWVPPPDPVIEAYKQDVDRTLLRASLRRSIDERVRALIALQRFANELRRAGMHMRSSV